MQATRPSHVALPLPLFVPCRLYRVTGRRFGTSVFPKSVGAAPGCLRSSGHPHHKLAKQKPTWIEAQRPAFDWFRMDYLVDI